MICHRKSKNHEGTDFYHKRTGEGVGRGRPSYLHRHRFQRQVSGGYTYVKVGDRQTDVKIDWQLLRAIEKGEVEIDNEKYHLSGIEYVAKRYQDMFYAGRDIYYFKGIGGHGMTDLLRNAIDDLLDTINSKETYRSAEHRVYAQMNKLTEAGAMISLAIELLTSNIRHSYGEINFERYPRPVEVEGEDKH